MRLPELTDRDSRLSTQIQHVAIRRWHATITATPGHPDHMIPTVDLGVFRSRKAAKAAAHLVVEHWTWTED